MYSQVLASTPKKVSLEKAIKKKKKPKKNICRKRDYVCTLSFLKNRFCITPMIRKTGINFINHDIITEEDFLRSTTTGFNGIM
jgi:hypothetical protein